MFKSYLDLKFDVLHAATNYRYADNKSISLVNLGPIALFSIYILTTGWGKHLEDNSHAPIVSLMYKLITSARDTDDLSIGFEWERRRRQRELTNNKNIKTKIHVRIMLKDVFGFSEHQEKANYGLGYQLTLTKNTDNSVLKKDNTINIGKTKNNAMEWYIPHYTPNISNQAKISKQILSRTPTELQYVERSFFMKKVNTQIFRTFRLGTQEGKNVPIGIVVGFQWRDRQDSQNLNNDTFCGLSVTSAQCIVGRESYPDSAILLNYDDNYNSQGYGQVKEAFRALTKDDISQP